MQRITWFVSLLVGASLTILLTMPSENAAAATGNPAAGRKIHVDNCGRCHGSQGRGDGPAAQLLKTKPANWTDKKRMSALSDDYLYKIIAGGGAAVGKSTLMPGFKGKLNDNQIRDVIGFIRSL